MTGLLGNLFGNGAGRALGRSPIPTTNALAYDTLLGQPLRSIVQNGVVHLLRRLLVSNGGYLQAVEPISSQVRGVHDEESIDEIYDQLRSRAPAVAVSVGDATAHAAGDVDRGMKMLDVHVYLIVQSLRNRVSRQQGDVVAAANRTADPGSFVALEHIEELLWGQIPGGTRGHVKELRQKHERLLVELENIELWEQGYEVAITRTINSKRDITVELRTITTYHRIDSQGPLDAPVVTTDTEVG